AFAARPRSIWQIQIHASKFDLRSLGLERLFLDRRRHVNFRVVLELYRNFLCPRPGERARQTLRGGTNDADDGRSLGPLHVEFNRLILMGQPASPLSAEQLFVLTDRFDWLA